MLRQRYIRVELCGGTWPQFSWEQMPGWRASVGEDVVDVHWSSASDCRVLMLMLERLEVFLWVWRAL